MSTETEESGQAVAVPSNLPPVTFSVTEESLAKLREKNAKLTKVTPENYDQFKVNVRELTGLRTGIEAERNEQLKSARKHTDDVNAEAKRVTALVAEIEAGPKKLKTDYDAKQKAIKEKAERENQERVDAINMSIDLIEEAGRNLDGVAADKLLQAIGELERDVPTEELFQEFLAVAIERHESSIARLTAARYKRIEFEREQQALTEEKEKLAKDQADANARQKIIDDENTEAAKQLRLDRELFDKEQDVAKEKAAAAQKVIDDAAQKVIDDKQAEEYAANQTIRDAEVAEEAAEAERNRIAQKAEDDAAAEAEALLMAPDKVKLARYASMIEALAEDAPELSNAKAMKVLARSVTALVGVSENLKGTADKL